MTMFREMRRKDQALSAQECARILESGTSGVLAVCGDDGYPYAVPMSYVLLNDRLYFHCAKSGHKLDAIAKSPKASFCVIDRDQVVPAEYTTYFRSVIAFGQALVLEDDAEKEAALQVLAEKYSPGDEGGRQRTVAGALQHVCIVELAIEHMTGKEATELVKARHEQ